MYAFCLFSINAGIIIIEIVLLWYFIAYVKVVLILCVLIIVTVYPVALLFNLWHNRAGVYTIYNNAAVYFDLFFGIDIYNFLLFVKRTMFKSFKGFGGFTENVAPTCEQINNKLGVLIYNIIENCVLFGNSIVLYMY